MGLGFSFLIACALILGVMLGVEVLGLNYLFAVIIPLFSLWSVFLRVYCQDS